MSKKLISVVVPAYNEAENIPFLCREVGKYIDSKKYSFEIIFVNDGSRDDTWKVIEGLATKDSAVKGIDLSRNYGHAAALEAGLIEAKGDVIIMMDADLQHPPSLIPKLISSYENGNEIVNTVRRSTQGEGLFKKLTSRMFYRFINSISELDLREGEADFRLLSRRALDAINALPETPKFYRGLVNWIGFDVDRVEYDAKDRVHGTSSYTLKKMIELARMGITSFSTRPLKIIFAIGTILTLLSSLLLVVMLIVKFFIDNEMISYGAILVDGVLLAVGLLTIFQGVVAIYLIDIFKASTGRPTFIVKKEVNLEDNK